MFVKDLISETISPLSLSDTGFHALQSMDVFKVSHLAIVDHGQFIGLISETEIFDMNDINKPISDYSLQLIKPYLFDYQHGFDAIEILSRLKLTAIPVLTIENEYLGMVTLAGLLQNVSTLLATSTPGVVIELDVEPINYSLSEIARIVEDTDSRILSCYLSERIQGISLSILIKIDRTDPTPVLHAFERYGYTITNTFTQDGGFDEKALKNYDALMRYLNI